MQKLCLYQPDGTIQKQETIRLPSGSPVVDKGRAAKKRERSSIICNRPWPCSINTYRRIPSGLKAAKAAGDMAPEPAVGLLPELPNVVKAGDSRFFIDAASNGIQKPEREVLRPQKGSRRFGRYVRDGRGWN